MTIWAALLIFFLLSDSFAQGTKVDVAQYRFMLKAKQIGEAINKGDYAALEREFDAQLQSQLPLGKLGPLLDNLIQGAGKIKNMGAPKVKWKDVAVIPVDFDSGMLDLRIDLNPASDKIAGFYSSSLCRCIIDRADDANKSIIHGDFNP